MDVALPDPAWPVVVLALICLVDAVITWRPADFVAACLESVRFPRRHWRLLVWLKAAAGVGLLVGLWLPYLGLLTTVCLVAYFCCAIALHLRARDFGRTLFVNATGMLLVTLAVLGWSFLF